MSWLGAAPSSAGASQPQTSTPEARNLDNHVNGVQDTGYLEHAIAQFAE